MPLEKPEDYPDGDTSLNYCKHCGTKDGIHPYKNLVKGMTEFMKQSQGLDEENAQKAAKDLVDNSEAVKMGVVIVEE
jgi:hypothetical protein